MKAVTAAVIAVCTIIVVFVSSQVFLGREKFGSNSKPLNIVFIGDSLTLRNNMTGTISQLLTAAGYKNSISYSAHDGWSLKEHWEDPRKAAITLIQAKKPDFLVLQDQTITPIFHFDEYIKYASKFAKLAPSTSKILLYEVPAHKKSDPLYAEGPYHTPDQMQDALTNAFGKAKRILSGTGATVLEVPIGPIWIQFPDRQTLLFNTSATDVRHPSPTGSVLNSMIFFKVITGRGSPMIPPFKSVPAQVMTRFVNAVQGVI